MKHSIISVALFLVLSLPATACTTPQNQTALLTQLFKQINAVRTRSNLPAFEFSLTLARGARMHACDNARNNRLSHIGTDGSSPAARVIRAGYDYAVVTENVAVGYAEARQVLDAWLRSPGHRRNIFDPRTSDIGIAITRGRDGRMHWVMNGGSELG